MSYETGTTDTPGNLLALLFNFAGANGWTIDDDIADDLKGTARGALHKNNNYICFEFTTSQIELCSARGFTNSSTTLGSHPSSSGTTGLTVEIPTSTIDSYYFFESDTYIHIVLDLDGDHFRHFGFGDSIKFGTWTGGEYSYGHYWLSAGNGNAANLNNSGNEGSIGTYTRIFGTKVGGAALPGANNASSKWGMCNDLTTNNKAIGADGDAVARNELINLSSPKGGISGGILSLAVSEHNGFVPLMPLQYALRDTSTAPDNFYFLGTYPDVRAVSLHALNPGQEYAIDTDIWVVFPITRKDYVSGITQCSYDQGIAYRKVTT